MNRPMWWVQRPLFIYLATSLAWALVVGVSLLHDFGILRRQAMETAGNRSRMLFDMIETTRLWNARHGGVYAVATDETPPNPYLDVPDRDFEALGRRFTLLNPAYMTRQIAELVQKRQDVTFHITSLNPIRPANQADSWETQALRRFDAGEREVLEYLSEQPPVFRYMAALPVREPCLKCHAKQGYKVGDVRGGISVTIPAASILKPMEAQRQQTMVLHLAMFLLASLGTALFVWRQRRHWLALSAAKAEQEAIVAARTAELRRSNQELEHFAYVASHDLREPLRMISSYAALLEKRLGGQLDADGKEFMGYLMDGATRLQAMINDLLEYSRVDRAQVTFVPVALEEALEEALVNLTVAIKEAGARVVHDPLPEVIGYGPLLVRLLQNLIGNAVKYRALDRPPVVRIEAVRDGRFWRVAIRDNGIGIPADAYDRIFQIFQRLHARSAYPGTGIGLAVCRRIVDRHGGRIWVESREGEGSTFFLTLPAA
ncbi:MAG: DUF3365 domain-containing protein [Magnetospirillum sp. WYHS-4]